MYASHNPDIFGLQGNDIHNITFNFRDIRTRSASNNWVLKWLDSSAYKCLVDTNILYYGLKYYIYI